MRIDEQNRILIAVSEVVPSVWKMDAYSWARRKGHICTTQRGGGGHPTEIIYNECSPRYQSKIAAVLGDPGAILGLTGSDKPIRCVSINNLTEKELTVCNARYSVVMQLREYSRINEEDMGKTAAKEMFVALYNEGHLCVNQRTILGDISFPTIERWNKALRDNGDVLTALAPARSEKKGRSLEPLEKDTLISCYCTDSKPSYKQAYSLACRILLGKGWKKETLPTSVTCIRFLKDYESNNAAIVTCRREGVKALRDTQLPYLERDPDSLKFLDCLVADGKVLNFQIAHPEHGRPCRATMIAWMDMRTFTIVGFELMVTENTKSVISSLYNACLNAGRLLGVDGAIIPRAVYLDNGRAFKNKTLNGSKENPSRLPFYKLFKEGTDFEEQVGGLFGALKPLGLDVVHYAKAYNARSKVIERAWQSFDNMEKMVVSYMGDCISNKPASLKRNELFHRTERDRAIASNGLPTLWGAYKALEWWIGEYNNTVSNGKYLKGNTPVNLAVELAAEVDYSNRITSAKNLDFMLMHSKTMKLGRNGVKINGTSYYNVLFANLSKSRECIVKYSLLDTQRVLVYAESGEFLCEAREFWGRKVHGLAALGSDSDREHYKQAVYKQSAIEKNIIKRSFSTTVNTSLMLTEAGLESKALTAGVKEKEIPAATTVDTEFEELAPIRLF